MNNNIENLQELLKQSNAELQAAQTRHDLVQHDLNMAYAREEFGDIFHKSLDHITSEGAHTVVVYTNVTATPYEEGSNSFIFEGYELLSSIKDCSSMTVYEILSTYDDKESFMASNSILAFDKDMTEEEYEYAQRVKKMHNIVCVLRNIQFPKTDFVED